MYVLIILLETTVSVFVKVSLFKIKAKINKNFLPRWDIGDQQLIRTLSDAAELLHYRSSVARIKWFEEKLFFLRARNFSLAILYTGLRVKDWTMLNYAVDSFNPCSTSRIQDIRIIAWTRIRIRIQIRIWIFLEIRSILSTLTT